MAKALPFDYLMAYRFTGLFHFVDFDEEGNDVSLPGDPDPRFMRMAKMKTGAHGLELWRGIRINQPTLMEEIGEATNVEIKVYGRVRREESPRRTFIFGVGDAKYLPVDLDATDSMVAHEGVLFRKWCLVGYEDEVGTVLYGYPGWWFKKNGEGDAVEWSGHNDESGDSVALCPSLDIAVNLVRRQQDLPSLKDVEEVIHAEEEVTRAKVARLGPSMQLTCPWCSARAFVPNGLNSHKNCHSIKDASELVCLHDGYVFGWWDEEDECWWSDTPLKEEDQTDPDKMPLPFSKG